MDSIAERITNLRKKKGISIIELADILGISRHSVYKWETDVSKPSTNNLKRLAEIFNSDLEYILSGARSCSNEVPYESDSYTDRLKKATSFSSITKTTTEFIKSLGLDKFLYNQIFRGDISNEPLVTILTDLRKDWQLRYTEKKYREIDPTWNYAATHTAPIFCDELIKQVSASDKKIEEFFADMREKIAPYFVVIPIHGPCCLATFVVSAKDTSKSSRNAIHNSVEALTHFGHHIYEATHRVAEKKSMQHNSSLTKKELSTINYLANGLSIKQIADKNFVTVAAVNARISNAKIKMGASNCEQLVLLAASAGLLPHNFGKMKKVNK